MSCDKPRHERDRGQNQHHGHEDGAGAVGEPLHGRARALRLIDHAGNLCEHRGLAHRLSAANHRAVVVERSSQHAAAGFAFERRRLAGQHRLVDRGAALQNGRVHRKALPWQDENAVACLNLSERHNGLDAGYDAACRDGTQAGERVESGKGAAFGSCFKAFAQQEKAEDQEHCIEVDLTAGSGIERGISGVGECHSRSQAHQRVHVRGAVA